MIISKLVKEKLANWPINSVIVNDSHTNNKRHGNGSKPIIKKEKKAAKLNSAAVDRQTRVALRKDSKNFSRNLAPKAWQTSQTGRAGKEESHNLST